MAAQSEKSGCSWSFYLVLAIGAYYVYSWLYVTPRVDWTLSSQMTFPECPSTATEKLLFVGPTSTLGRYVVQNLIDEQKDNLCIIGFARSTCRDCTVHIHGDLRDIRLVRRMMDFYRPDTVLTAIKPALLGVHYRTYIELNLLSMVQLIDAAVDFKVKNFIYVSSIAAAGHYFAHFNAKESDEKPFYTDYEAPYDVSKRFTEDYLLNKAALHPELNTISLRISGVVAGEGDPYYDYYKFPVLPGLHPPPPYVDSNFAGNIAEGIKVVYERMVSLKPDEKCTFCGQFYYFTGEPFSESLRNQVIAESSGKLVLTFPRLIAEWFVELIHWARFEKHMYSTIDMLRMALVPQTFDNSKFKKTFPEYKPLLSNEVGLRHIYGVNSRGIDFKKAKTDL